MRRVSINGRTLPAVGMGTWHLGRGNRDEREEIAAIKTGLDLGLKVIDTAEMYGRGRSERLIGKAIEGRRQEVFLTSKVFPWHANRFFMERACNASLKRLGTDYLDLYLLHWRIGCLLPEAVWCLERLRAKGKIKAWGVSNFDVRDMEEIAHLSSGENCSTNQIFYAPRARGAEYLLLDWCREHDIPVMAYSPLGGVKRSLLMHPIIKEIADSRHISSATLLIAWSIRMGNVLSIPQTGSWEHIYENAAALNVTLKNDELELIDKAFPSPKKKIKLQRL